MNKTKTAEIAVWDNKLLVEYIVNDRKFGFVIVTLKDIECLKKELIEAGYIKAKEHWQK